MGVPAFFKWLTLRYPNIVIDANENIPILNGLDLNKIISSNYIDSSLPSIDNLYFDMNGIIHPCAHPQDRDSPESLTEMFNAIFDYVDKIIRIIKPKKLIYMAIDGCAPRAKMNQQRSRRFRAALEAQERKELSEEIKKEWKKKNLYNFLNNNNKNSFEFDSNCITPGTEFLYECGKAIHQYIKSRINNNELWKNLTVIFSDSSVPGEGEHKILDFIRSQRTFKEYNPNTSHCIYGADADLIMLSLIMHEPNFYILRETLNEKFYLICEKCGKHGHISAQCEQTEKKFNRETASFNEIYENNKEKINEIDFCLIKINMVRAYIKLEFEELINKFKLDLERIIDDFVFICFLVGNDFLPHLPSLKIREGAIDALIYLYKKIRPEMDDYFTNGKGQLNLKNCEILFKKLSLVEDEFFKQENINKINEENYRKNNNVNNINNNKNILEIFDSIGKEKNNNNNNNKNSNNKDEIDLIEITDDILNIENKKEFKDFSIDELKKNGKNTFNQILSEKIKKNNNFKVKTYIDPIKLGENGWKDRYYFDKFHMKPDNKDLPNLKQKIKQFYIEGLCWVFEYYYNGCISWEWYYPFHYAPFASDLIDIKNLVIKFNYGSPFNSFEQLLSVLPPFSYKALPKCLQNYMFDPLSSIADFYPQKIKLDINNQPFVWMGVNLIPFIDESRIKKVVENNLKLNNFSEKELELNKVGNNLLFCNSEKFKNYVQGNFEIDENKNSFNENVKFDKINDFKGLFLENK